MRDSTTWRPCWWVRESADFGRPTAYQGLTERFVGILTPGGLRVQVGTIQRVAFLPRQASCPRRRTQDSPMWHPCW